MTKSNIERSKRLNLGQRKHVVLPSGQYKNIGIRDIMIGFSRAKGILLRLYYPAKDQSTNIDDYYLCWPNWMPHENYEIGYADAFSLNFCTRLGMLFKNTFIPVLINTKPLRIPGLSFPVIVFSHDNGTCRSTYSSICTDLASHGFVVAGNCLLQFFLINFLFTNILFILFSL